METQTLAGKEAYEKSMGVQPDPRTVADEPVGIEQRDNEFFTDELAALGSETIIGNMTVNVSVARIALLKEIDSPFCPDSNKIIEMDDGRVSVDYELVDVAKALYVLAEGPKALTLHRQIRAKRKYLEIVKPMAEKSAEHMEVYIERLEECAELEAKFECIANEYIEGYFNEAGMHEAAVNDLFMAMKDCYELVSEANDARPETTEKKS